MRLSRLVFLALGGVVSGVAAQTAPAPKKPLTIDDYSRWRSIEGAAISGDGQWVAYTLRHANSTPAASKPVLRIRRLDAAQDVEVEGGSNPTFSPDSRWLVYQLDSVPAPRRNRPDTAKAAPPERPPRMELRELATGTTRSWERMNSAVFSPSGKYLALHRRPATGRPGGPGGPGGPGSQAAGNEPRGADAVLVELATGRALFLGSVGELAFSRSDDRLAYSVEASPNDANGLFVLDLTSGRTLALDNDARSYARLTWNETGTGLAALKGKAVEKKRERDNLLIAFAGLGAKAGDPIPAALTLDPAKAEGFPPGFVVSERGALLWSEDGNRVFFGILPQRAAADTGKKPSTDSIADVDVWRTQDQRIQSVQMIRASADRNFTFREAFDLASGRFVRLADSTMRNLELAPDGRWAVGRDESAYVSDWRPDAADFYRVNPASGERSLMFKDQLIGPYTFGISPDGRRFLYWKDRRFMSYDLDRGTTTALGGQPEQFADPEWDYTGPRPPAGIAGYTSDGNGVIVSDRYDLWVLPLDGGAPRNLTGGEGARREIQFRIVRTTPIDSTAPRRVRTGREVDLSQPVTLSGFGEFTKQNGFFRLTRGSLAELVYDDAYYTTPTRADHAERFLFTRQTFRDFPDLRVAGADFRDATPVSEANPQQAEYVWGRRILFDYQNKDGVRLQGLLAIPDDYQPGQKRPMLVSFYEKNSQNLNRYPMPSYLTGMGSLPVEGLSRGYLLMLADVHFRTGSSHSDMLESVEAATRKVIEMGYADPAHIGVHGHSYGGEGAAFIATRSKLFAAAGMGAGVTDLYSDFSQSWGWSYQVSGGSGDNGSGYYMYGQGRWGFSPWEKPEVYHFESALTHAPEVSQPVLIMHGTADPTVAFSEGMNFYNALRFNGKTAYLLAYPGEGHGLRGLANRRDLTIRYFEFFDHYLKGAPAPKWMSDGVPFLVKTDGAIAPSGREP